jgi:molybdopterin synthase catalytic subunit
MLRERAGARELQLDLPEGARVADALERMADLADGLPLVMSINGSYATRETELHPSDELALIPPVSGGAVAAGPWARVTGEPLSADALAERVRDPRAGAVVTFRGVTREVARLEYEAYAEMAEAEIRAILRAVIERHGLCGAAAEHRVGAVELGEPSVIVAVAAPHRGVAFAGAREAIDAIKARAPIWKREVRDDGSATWVPGTPPPTG